MRKMEKTLLNKLGAGEELHRREEGVMFKTESEITTYQVLDTMAPVSEILEFVFTDNKVRNFSVSCSDEQYFIAGLNYIRDFKITGVVESGKSFELTFNSSVDVDELLNVEDEREYIGNEAWGERTNEWSSESSIDTDSDMYKFLLKQAEALNMDVSVLEQELEQIAEHCTGSDVEY